MKKVTHIIRISMITNFFLALIKLIFGIIGKSSALMADGIHSFSDLSTDVVAFLGNKVSLKPADEKHPYGHGKAEYLTGLVIGIFVFLLGISLIINSFDRNINNPSMVVIFISLLTIIIKYILSSYLIHSGKKYDNQILIASGKESSTDVISSFFVLISSVFMQLSYVVPIFKYSDIVASVIVGLFIVHTGFLLIKDNVSVILGEQEIDEEILSKVENVILSSKEIIGIDKLVILKFGYICSIICEVCMDGEMKLVESHNIVDKIEKNLKKLDKRYEYINIHINPK